MDDHHGVYYLEKKEKKIKIQESNLNDILEIFGEPSTKSTFDNDIWIYIERKITNSHFFGKRDLIINNVLVLEIDKKGILVSKKFYNKNDMKKLKFDEGETGINRSKKSFIYNFLSSVRQKIDDPLGKKRIKN